MPRAGVDKNIYKYPVGAYQWSLWKAGTREFQVNYREDPRALKLLSQAQWEGERPLWDVRTYQPVGTTEAIRSARYVSMQRTLNYLRRMVPHVLGYFPFITVWVCLIAQYYNAVHDLEQITDRTIPEWVSGALFGTAIIFTSFAFVQAIFQALPPGFYCKLCNSNISPFDCF